MKRALLLVAVLLGCSSPPPPPPPPTEEELVQRTNIDLGGVDLAEVVVMLSREVGVRIRADSSVNEAVWVSMTDAPWTKILDAVAAQGRCVIEEQPDGTLLLVHPPDAPRRDARKVLTAIATWCGAYVRFDDGFNGEAHSDLRGLDVDDAIQQVLDDVGGHELAKEDRDHWRVIPKR